MTTSLWIAIIDSPTNEVVKTSHVFSGPSHWIVLSVQIASRHEGIVVCSNGVKAVVDRKVRKTNSILDEGFMETQGYMRTGSIMANCHAIDIR